MTSWVMVIWIVVGTQGGGLATIPATYATKELCETAAKDWDEKGMFSPSLYHKCVRTIYSDRE